MAITVVFPEREGGSSEEIATALQAAQAAQAGAETARDQAAEILEDVQKAGSGSLTGIEAARVAAIADVEGQEATSIAAVGAAGANAVSDVEAQEVSSIAAVAGQGTTSVAAVVTQQGTSVAAVQSQQTTSVAAVASQQTTSVNAVTSAQTTAVNAVSAQQTTSVAAVVTQETTSIAAVSSAAATMISAAAAGDYEVLARARLDTQVSTGARDLGTPEFQPVDWVLTNVTRNVDGTYTGTTGGTMVLTTTGANYIVPGNRYAYVTRADTVTGEDTITIGVTSPVGSTTMATAASTTEPKAGVYRQTWTNSLSRSSVVITITFATAGTVYDPEVYLTDSSRYPLVRRYDEVVPVPQLPVRVDLFEWWKRPGMLSYDGRRALEKSITYAVDQSTGTDTPSGTLYAPSQKISNLPAFANGNIFGVRCGGSFRETLTQARVTSFGTKGNTLVGYTLGAAMAPFPRLSAFEPIATGDWTANGDGSFSVTKTFTSTPAPQDDGYQEVVVWEIDLALEAQGLYDEARRIMKRANGGNFTASASGITLTVTGTPPLELTVGQVFSGTGVTPGTTITAYGTTGTGAAGTYTISNNLGTLSSRTMTVTLEDDVKSTGGRKAATISGSDVTIRIRPTNDGVIGTDYRYEYIARWCALDCGDADRDFWIHGVELEGASYGYGPLHGPDRTVADRLILTGCRQHLAVIEGGSVSNFFVYQAGVEAQGLTFYTSDATGQEWSAKRGFSRESYSPIYSHRGAGGNWTRGEIEDMHSVYGRRATGRHTGALRGTIAAAVQTAYTAQRRHYARGFFDTGIITASEESLLEDFFFDQLARFQTRNVTRRGIVIGENPSGLSINDRSQRLLEVRDGDVIEYLTLIATNVSNAVGDYTPTIFSPAGTITTNPIIRNCLIIVAPELVSASTGASTIVTLPSSGVSQVTSNNNVWVFGKGSRFTVGQASGSTTHTWASYLSRTGQDANSTMIDARDNPYGLADIYMDFANRDLRYKQSRLASRIQAACERLNAGCPWTIDRRPDEPSPQEIRRILWSL